MPDPIVSAVDTVDPEDEALIGHRRDRPNDATAVCGR